MKKICLTLALLMAASLSWAQGGVQIRRNQVGCYPDQEKVVVIEGVNPSGKVKVTTPDGRVVRPKVTRKSVSPWSHKTRYVVDLGSLTATGDYRVTVSSEGEEERQITFSLPPLAGRADGKIAVQRDGVTVTHTKDATVIDVKVE
jgi:hypothetical protein